MISDNDPPGPEEATDAGGTAPATQFPRSREPIEKAGKRHWRESTITRPGLDDRGDVFFAAIEMTRMPMILTDPNQPDNPIVFANKAFLDLTGYEDSEIIGRNCRFLQGPNTDADTVNEVREAVRAGESIAVEILNYKRDGTPFWNALFIGPVHDTDGKLVYQFASQLDVTRRRQTEQAYRQAQKMEAIGQLTAGLAHDFNNLLQVVDGNLELLSGRIGDDDRGKRYLESARGAAERGAKLTRQLLAFARKSRLEPKPVDLTALVSDFADVIESSLGSRIALELNLRRRLPPVHVDRDQLELAILNIVVNARDALPGGGTVSIATRPLHLNGDAASRDLPLGDYVCVEIRDDGDGMTAEVAERAVEPFFTTKKQGKGTGLGLAMASGFVQQSRGRLEIESKPGEGSLFRLIFPVSHQAVEAGEAAPSRAGQGDGDSGSSTSEHILVVEDSAEVLKLAREILETAGYRVTTAESGDEAIRIFDTSADRFDLLFTDLVMPGGINGLMLAEEIVKRAPDLPVLMTTGYNEELVVSGPTRLAQDVLGKPYRKGDLLDRVRQAIDHQVRGDKRRQSSDFGAAEA